MAYAPLETEQRFIGSILADADAIHTATDLIKSPDSLETPALKKIYAAMLILQERGALIDMVSVSQELAEPGIALDLMDASNSVVTHHHLESLAKTILNARMSEEAYKVLNQSQKDLIGGEDVLDVIETCRSKLEIVTQKLPTSEALKSEEVAMQAVILLASLGDPKSGLVQFGIVDIDRVIGGGIPGNLIVVGGKRKSGKTTLGLKAGYFGASRGYPLGIFSREMSSAEILVKEALNLARIKYTSIVSNSLTMQEKGRLSKAIETLSKLPVYMDDQTADIRSICSAARRLKRHHGVKVVIVDYVQIVEPDPTKRFASREQEVASISRALKKLAREEGMVVIALSQLSEENKSRESRGIENDADKLIFLDTHEDDDPVTNENGREVDVKIVQRFGLSGSFGDVKIFFDTQYGYFKSYEEGMATSAAEIPKAF